MFARSPASSAHGFSALEMLFVLGITGVIAAIAVPLSGNALGYYRLSGDARSVSNALSVTKMRAAATFGRARIYIDLSSKSITWRRRRTRRQDWVADSGFNYLNSQNSFGYGVGGKRTAEHTDDHRPGVPVPRCVLESHQQHRVHIFNSRGIPIDSNGSPIGSNALYLTDGTAVYGATLSATGMTAPLAYARQRRRRRGSCNEPGDRLARINRDPDSIRDAARR